MAATHSINSDICAQCQFISAFYALTMGEHAEQWWTCAKGLALLHQVPVLMNGFSVDERNAFLTWFQHNAQKAVVSATQALIDSNPSERALYAPILQTCTLVKLDQ